MTTMQQGQRAQFHDGQRGVIAQVLNGGTLYLFASDTGATFTARADEIAAEALGRPKAPTPLAAGECRTVYRMDAPARLQRTPAQQQQAQHAPDDDAAAGYDRDGDPAEDGSDDGRCTRFYPSLEDEYPEPEAA
mgnify:CR=1 FL=1